MLSVFYSQCVRINIQAHAATVCVIETVYPASICTIDHPVSDTPAHCPLSPYSILPIPFNDLELCI